MRNLFILSFAMVMLLGCVQTKTAKKDLEPIKSLPSEQLAEYNDTFESYREDLWGQSFHLFRRGEENKFRAADIFIKDGQLVLKTPKDEFSSGVCDFRYWLVGDFDVQLDMAAEFQNQRQGAHLSFFNKVPIGKETNQAAFIVTGYLPRKKMELKVLRAKVKVASIRASSIKKK